jgi:hypothetical protein
MKKFFIGTVLIVLSLFLTSSTNNHKYDQKLFGCIDKVIRLIEWKTKTDKLTFEIGFMGDQQLFTTTQNYFRGKTYLGKPIKITHYLTADLLKKGAPMALYIGKHKNHNLDELTAVCAEKHIFSISDDQTNRNDIPLVLLHVHEEMVDIIVNKTEAEKQSFKLSYHLIRAAKEVR